MYLLNTSSPLLTGWRMSENWNIFLVAKHDEYDMETEVVAQKNDSSETLRESLR